MKHLESEPCPEPFDFSINRPLGIDPPSPAVFYGIDDMIAQGFADPVLTDYDIDKLLDQKA